MVGRAGFEPATNRLCAPLQLSLPLSSLWSGLSLHPPRMPAVQSLHLSPDMTSGDLARDYHVYQASPNLTGYTYRLPDKQPLTFWRI